MPTTTWDRLPAERREAVLAAAEAEFAARGFSGGSLNTIVREAGISKGSLFQYFDDKADLYAYLAELASVRIRASMEAYMATLDWNGDFLAALEAMLVRWMAYFDEHPVDRAITAAVNLEPDESSRRAVRVTVNRHYVAVLKPLLEEGRRTGGLRADADLDTFLALLMLTMPHLAIAPHHDGLDPVFGLHGGGPDSHRLAVTRIVAVFRAAFGPV